MTSTFGKNMTTNAYIGYFGGALVVVPVGALIAQHACTWIARFRPSYSKALLSTVIAYVSVNLAGLLVGGSARGLQFLVGLIILACSHVYLLRSGAGDRISAGKAFIVALCQIIGAGLALLIVLLVLLGLKRLFT